ncbi:lipoprotein LpqB [Nocardia nova SH22a]|uniref:Lipoprotein LpqB n=1 Tax=Nocardia nova SH22a TaxID=1415166 RepID=W5TV83_9NOCA|nr:MtrAB system accessory lipoprotein LpqB [Nocardia nova]AHH21081.1 lipoprotein LpqB [Nocardia nova SH22a]
MNRTRLATLLGALFGCVLLVSGCASLPDSSAPQALGTISREPTSAGPHPPVHNQDPDLLLHDFMAATADPADHHQTARQYLTPDASQSWDDEARTIIVDKPDTLRESRTDNTVTFRVRGRKLGELGADGSFRAQDNTTYETRIEMTKVGDDWRIDQLEPGVVVDSGAFYKAYHRYSLYFANGPGTMAVPDLRWVATTKDQLAQELVTLLAGGPREALAPAVRNLLADPVSLRTDITKANGATDNVGVGLGGVRMDFSGASTLDPHNRELLAAQVVLTLSNAGIIGPYVLLGDGKPLDERYAGGWTSEDVNAFNPAAHTGDHVGLHALRDGGLVKVDPVKGDIVPTPGFFGSAHNLRSAGLSQDGQLVAAVADSGQPAPKQTLVVGSYDGAPASTFSVIQGDTFTRPSWTADGGAVWTVIDGTRVVRFVHDRATGNVSMQNVDSSTLTVADSNSADSVPRLPITDLRISRDGARAAIIAGGKVYMAVVVAQPDGQFSLVSPQPVAVDSSTTAVSIDWSTPEMLVIARDGDMPPVDSVFVDGSELKSLSSQNLTPPVRVVSAAPEALYAADSRAVMQLQAADPASDRFWREVPGLGANAVPVFPG